MKETLFCLTFEDDFNTIGETFFKKTNIRIDENTKIGKGTKIYSNTVIKDNVTIGRNCVIGNFALIREGATLGDGVKIGAHTTVEWSANVGDGTNVQGHNTIGECSTIGKNCFIASFVVNMGDNEMLLNPEKYIPNATNIEDNVRVGTGTKILPAYTIKNGAFVGAASLVTSDIPENEMWYGCPARKVRNNER